MRYQPTLLFTDACGKSYVYASELNRHMENSHSKVKDQICNFCGKSFGIFANLKRHIETTHIPLPPPPPLECKLEEPETENSLKYL